MQIPPVMLLTSLLVGVGSGLGAVLFRRHLIDWLHNFAYSDIAGLLTEWYPLHLILIPAIGGAIVGPLVYYFAREAKGHGVPEVMEATGTTRRQNSPSGSEWLNHSLHLCVLPAVVQ